MEYKWRKNNLKFLLPFFGSDYFYHFLWSLLISNIKLYGISKAPVLSLEALQRRQSTKQTI